MTADSGGPVGWKPAGYRSRHLLHLMNHTLQVLQQYFEWQPDAR